MSKGKMKKIVTIVPTNSKESEIKFKIKSGNIYRFFIEVDNLYTEVFLESNFLLYGNYRSGKSVCFDAVSYLNIKGKNKSSHGHCSHYSSSFK